MTTLLTVLLLGALGLPQTTNPGKPADVAAAVQRRYDAIRDFSADFTHTHEGGVLRRKLVEQGTLLVKRPGKMRWDYTSPEKKLFVSNGKRLYFHDPANNQVTVSDVPQGDDATSAAQFLSGRGNLPRDFEASFLPGATPDIYALKLQPRRTQDDFDWLELVVDRETLQLKSLTAVEKQGGRSTFTFSRVKENIGAADNSFEFRIPRGVEVIHAGRGKN